MNLLDELRLRRWARENYAPIDERSGDWDSVILDEMRRRDEELAFDSNLVNGFADDPGSKIVPLAPATWFVDAPHLGPDCPHFLSRPVPEPLEEAREWGLYLG